MSTERREVVVTSVFYRRRRRVVRPFGRREDFEVDLGAEVRGVDEEIEAESASFGVTGARRPASE